MSPTGKIDMDWIRQRLIDRRDGLSEQLRKLERDRRRADTPLEQDFGEQAVQRENDEVLDELHERSRQELERIELALRRMDAGDYGTCLRCGEAIGVLRLNALPHASHCVACAQNLSTA